MNHQDRPLIVGAGPVGAEPRNVSMQGHGMTRVQLADRGVGRTG